MAENDADRAKYDFKKAMQEITSYRGRGTELISVYVPENKQISEVMAYLRNEQSQASNIKSKTTMNHVQSAIDSIAARLKTYKAPPANGVVIFCGEVPRAGDQTKMVQYVINPPRPSPRSCTGATPPSSPIPSTPCSWTRGATA